MNYTEDWKPNNFVPLWPDIPNLMRKQTDKETKPTYTFLKAWRDSHKNMIAPEKELTLDFDLAEDTPYAKNEYS